MTGDFRCDRGDYARVLFSFVREAAGASSARHSLRPLISQGGDFLHSSGASRCENACSCLKIGAVIASEAKQSISPRGRNGLLRRGACHRARIRATRWLLAMTGPHGRRFKKFQTCKNLFRETTLLTCRSSAQRRRGPIAQLNQRRCCLHRRRVRRSLNPSGDPPCPSALHFCPPPPSARWLLLPPSSRPCSRNTT